MSSSAISGPIFSDNKRAPSGTAAAPSFAFNDSTGTGVYLVSPGVLGLSTAGVQRVVVDASGNVGIGTASPLDRLHINHISNAALRATTTTNSTLAAFGADNSGGYLGSFSAHPLLFYAGGGTERMRIDAGGNLLVGGSSAIIAGTRLQIYATTAGGTGVASAVNTNQNTKKWSYGPDGNGNFLVFNDAGVGMYILYGANGWTASSDERIKKNIKPLELGLEQIKALKPARFDYNQDESESSARVGFIAQEVLPVLPHAVHAPEDSEQIMGVSTTEMIPVLVKAIQELEARLAALEAK